MIMGIGLDVVRRPVALGLLLVLSGGAAQHAAEVAQHLLLHVRVGDAADGGGDAARVAHAAPGKES